jgi:hypothetical protein
MLAAGMNRAAARAYTRVVLRLRAQCEVEADLPFSPQESLHPQHSGYGGQGGRPPIAHRLSFRSPLYKARRAPLLRVFVPSVEGDWLSDQGVVECEDEMKRAGVRGLLRVGDVVWDCAVGDEGNAGRLVWDGNFLIVSGGSLVIWDASADEALFYFHDLLITRYLVPRRFIYRTSTTALAPSAMCLCISTRSPSRPRTSTVSCALSSSLVAAKEILLHTLTSHHGVRKSHNLSGCCRTRSRRMRLVPERAEVDRVQAVDTPL